VVLLVLAGCAGAPASLSIRAPAEPLRLLAVAPVVLRYEGDPYEAPRRSEDVLALLWRDTRWAILGPTEFMVLATGGADPIRNTDLMSKVRDLPLHPERVALLETVLSIREAQGRSEVRGERGTAVGAAIEQIAVVSMSVVSPRGLVFEIEHTKPMDPFAERPDWDERPTMREALREATKILIDSLGPHLEPVEGPDLDAIPSPAVVLRGYRSDGRGTSARLEDELSSWRIAQYLDPAVTLAESARLARGALAFCVRGDPPYPLSAGDCVTAIDGHPAASPHALRRRRAFANGAALALTIVGADGLPRRATFR